ncbi:MAG TPA: sodium-dependent bicarbonate transport family permease [Chitinophagaceae bacterium]|nr:sodium-dependent bicarbonate transport family permease [Chitinophagaceae bacterium]
MDNSSFEILVSNLTNPTLLFFLLGIVAALLRSDLEIPATSLKFISLYLLFSIGFKGGQELEHGGSSAEIWYSILFGTAIATLIPIYSFYLLKNKVGISNAGAIAASYGSVSAVTFVSAVSFLEIQGQPYGAHMIAVMALMEFPAIIMGFVLIMKYDKGRDRSVDMGTILKHAISNGSVLMIVGSLIIGIVADSKQAEGIKPFTTDIFKGFLAIFLLEMGMITVKRFSSFKKHGLYVFLFAILMPLFNGCVVALLSQFISDVAGTRFIFAILAASASYIAVPAAMRLAAPNSDPGLYIPMALGVTFPLNITLGFPLYYYLVQLG